MKDSTLDFIATVTLCSATVFLYCLIAIAAMSMYLGLLAGLHWLYLNAAVAVFPTIPCVPYWVFASCWILLTFLALTIFRTGRP